MSRWRWTPPQDQSDDDAKHLFTGTCNAGVCRVSFESTPHERRDRLIRALNSVFNMSSVTGIAARANAADDQFDGCISVRVMLIPVDVNEPGCLVEVHVGAAATPAKVVKVIVDRVAGPVVFDDHKCTHFCYDFVELVLNHPITRAVLLLQYPNQVGKFELEMLDSVKVSRTETIDALIASTSKSNKGKGRSA